MAQQKITLGKWEQAENTGVIVQNGRMVAHVAIDDTKHPIAGVAERTHIVQFICECANQCQAVNPQNPLAVAQKIKAMHEALKLYQKHQQGTSGHYCSDCANTINEVLTAIEEVEAKGK